MSHQKWVVVIGLIGFWPVLHLLWNICSKKTAHPLINHVSIWPSPSQGVVSYPASSISRWTLITSLLKNWEEVAVTVSQGRRSFFSEKNKNSLFLWWKSCGTWHSFFFSVFFSSLDIFLFFFFFFFLIFCYSITSLGFGVPFTTWNPVIIPGFCPS